ncbi:GntR family transcriptional regulator [Pseudomonas sp. MOB-449]|nr:GntR family transcriptional regulator [Pseudomonas sp. MOB-449]
MTKKPVSAPRAVGAKGKRGSNAASVYEQLRTEIISMELAPGTVLDEVSLSNRFKLSRSPVREAIIRLANDGLVTVLPNRSTIVSVLDFQGLRDLFDALELLQRLVTRQAAANRKDDHIVRMRKYQEEFTRSLEAHDLHSMLAANYNYHIEVAEAAGNKYFKLLYGRVLDEGKRLLFLNFRFEADAESTESSPVVHEHEDITKAIEDRDCDLAERLGYEHAISFRKRVLKIFERSGTSSIKL